MYCMHELHTTKWLLLGSYQESTFGNVMQVEQVVNCLTCQSSPECVCGDGWFNLWALTNAPQVCSLSQPQTNQPDWGQVRLLKPATNHTHSTVGLSWITP